MQNHRRHHAYVSFWTMLSLALLLPMMAFAQNPPAAKNSMAEVLCAVGGWLWGPLGQVLGVLAIICLGLAAMFGKIQVTTVLTTMAGIAIMLGAPEIVQNLGLGTQCTSATTAVDIMTSPIYRSFACIIGWFTGPVGKSLATLSIIVLGVFALYGKISYHQGLVVAAGIAAMFGAGTIVGSLGIPSASGNISLGTACGSGFLANVYCSVINWFNGPLGKGMATMGIIIIGLGALYGKVSWGLAIICAVGIALIFGGTTIVDALGGAGSGSCPHSDQNPSSLVAVFCNVVNWFNGPIGKGIATLAIIIVGLGALFGKISWTSSLLVAVGVALIFGGTTMVASLGGPDGACPSGDMLNPTSNGTPLNPNPAPNPNPPPNPNPNPSPQG